MSTHQTASPNDTGGRCLLIQEYFGALHDYTGKADLSKGYWNPKRKLGVRDN